MEVFLITFLHGNYAIAAFNRLQRYGIKNAQLIQTPFSIKSECDFCIKTNDRETLDFILKECRGVSNVYSQVYKNGRYVYKLLP
ncbi:MAG TPA: DUF3343 domain-containing protein [Sedimentibacter sp.]|nr:DUF3343 domain-containing protein [Sedimentibacter sp.]HOK48699.1 DUF3343 domain-containing protein [Sedimentibacter sp.]HOW23295.1 DUF3343 domain-containing protein [Sedimentibacter sp.]HRC81951.1 DUF3343 domain-containing protein [Sedimentibacter sp.]